jgi:hypothetical protein
MHAPQTRLWILLATVALGCRGANQVPEPGAVLLRLTVTPGAPIPDELRVFVYDDSGTLWSNVRIPEQGALAPESADRLGTILIQPGTSTGTLRIHVGGLAGGVRVVDGILTIPPEARARGTFDLRLDPAMVADDDGDGVPNQIDDCPAGANPAQGGCPDGGNQDASSGTDASIDSGGDRGNEDASSGTDAPFDSGDDSEAACDAAGGCDKPQGATCSGSAACASGFCVDGICCASACLGPCRSCNQPNADGICQGYAASTDPYFECTASGTTCDGAGACGPQKAPGTRAKGELCGAAAECSSGFCKDGVCCNTACTNPCQSCGTGTCQPVKRTVDVPECVAPMTCNATGKCVTG